MSQDERDAITALRAATRELHQRLDNVDYSLRLARGDIRPEDYAHFLQTMRVLQASLAELRGSATTLIESVAGTREQQLARLDQDLADLAAPRTLPPMLTEAGQRLADAIASSANRPDYALGIVYVVEGSSMGALHQRKVLREHPLLQDHPHRYLAGDGSATRQRFGELILRLNSTLSTPESVAEACAGAEMTFARVYDLLSAI